MTQIKLNSQRGVASLLTALVLLICITLVALVSSKTVLVETQIAADNYRASQAVAAANYALDYGVNYFDAGGFDRVVNASGTGTAITGCTPDNPLPAAGSPGSDCIVDTGAADTDGDGTIDQQFNALSLKSADLSQTTTATLAFNNAAGTYCVAAGATPDMQHGMITATGFSDDSLATRTITQCIAPLNILRDNGPKQPLVAQGNVALTGNARIINRYTDTTVWSGGLVQIGSSSAMETFINSTSDPATTEAERIDTDDDEHAQLVSNRNLGNGLDIIDDDPSLGNLVGLEFFKNFFAVETRAQLKQIAVDNGQSYTNISSALNPASPAPATGGLVWIEGNQSMNGGTIGSLAKPAIVVVNGDMTLTGGATIYGLLYVAGTYTINGTPQIIGANIVEGTDLTTNLQAAPPIVSGTGTISLVYWPAFAAGSGNPLPSLTAVVSGSWRDW
ncbi:MAG: hypothetical protein LUQ11_01530 [Methylococcaceae bacterium]|nr:hypothetical protein [Methylococcaceae bacterium]